MHIVRLAGFIVAALAAAAIFVFLPPDDVERVVTPSIEGIQESIERAIEDYETNAVNAGDDIALQDVVNGIAAKDLLSVIAAELQVMTQQIEVLSVQTDGVGQGVEPDTRVPALLMVGVLTFVFHVATLPFVGSTGVGSAPRVTAVPARMQRNDATDESEE